MRARVLSEGDDALDARVLGLALEARELAVVAIDHRCTAVPEPQEDFGLGVGDRLDRAEKFEMHRLDRGDDRHVRPHQPGQRLDLAGMIHSHFEHGVARVFGTARERERNAPMIVVRGGGCMGFAACTQCKTQRLFGAGLADRAGDADDARARAIARRARQIAQAIQHVGDHQQWELLRKAVALRGGDDRKPGARLDRTRDEVVTVTVVALDGEEGFAGSNGARVDRDAGDRTRQ